MRHYSCPYIHDVVVLTNERTRHIQQRHPGVLPAHFRDLERVLEEPEVIRWSPRTRSTRLFSRWLRDLGEYLVVVVVTPPRFVSPPWIITAYFADRTLDQAWTWKRTA